VFRNVVNNLEALEFGFWNDFKNLLSQKAGSMPLYDGFCQLDATGKLLHVIIIVRLGLMMSKQGLWIEHIVEATFINYGWRVLQLLH
jgi:hypothetical protein